MIVTAHRGLPSEAPENTPAAFLAAIDAGFAAIELDLRRTHDGEVVVLHDASVDRTTDGCGRVADMDYDDLRGHDTGAGPVPRLEEVLVRFADTPVLWNLELKDRRAAPDAVSLVRHHGLQERVQYSSMDPRALAAVRSDDADAVRGLIVAGSVAGDAADAARRLGATWLNVHHTSLDARAVDALHAQGTQVGAWTVNDPERAAALAAMGADAVITDTRAVLERLRVVAAPVSATWVQEGRGGHA